MLSLQTVLPHTLELIKRLMAQPLFSDMRLVGGTALALQYAHRRSIDIDMFGVLEPDTSKVTEALKEFGMIKQGGCSQKVKTYELDGVKVDFVDYSAYPWLDEPVVSDGIRLASPRDIAAMKINAIQGRGSRKDFVDMYFLLQYYSLSEIISFYAAKYPEHSEYRAMLSLTYFEDAETQPMPYMLQSVTWPEMKSFILQSVEDYNNQRSR